MSQQGTASVSDDVPPPSAAGGAIGGASADLGAGKRAAVIGVVATGALFLLLAGALQFLQGLAAVLKADFFVVGGPEFAYSFNVNAWGWIHLIMGILMVVTGFALLTGAWWARVVAITLAVFSIMANFMFLPFYPAWAIIIIAVDVALIWALSNYGRAVD